jgi:tRNA-Thr(GGU) m(6)t(6)A37 methyltransferase TsaA
LVFGHDVVRDAAAVRDLISLTGQYASADDGLTGRENLVLLGRLHGLSSGGMRRRLDIAAGLIVTPALLFLDEPTTGLDPRSRGEVWSMVRGLVGAGATVLLTTQYLDEADRIADRIAVIDHGTVIAEGTSSGLKASVGGGALHVRLGDRDDRATAGDAARLAARLRGRQPGHPPRDRRARAHGRHRFRRPDAVAGAGLPDTDRDLRAAVATPAPRQVSRRTSRTGRAEPDEQKRNHGMALTVTPIGTVRCGRADPQETDHWADVESVIEVAERFGDEPFTGLADFSHVEVVFVFDRLAERPDYRRPLRPRGRAELPAVGVFADRGPRRPNRIGCTICEIVSVAGRCLRVRGLDAVDGTPVLDIKPVLRQFLPERVRQPAWVDALMRDYFTPDPRAKDGAR